MQNDPVNKIDPSGLDDFWNTPPPSWFEQPDFSALWSLYLGGLGRHLPQPDLPAPSEGGGGGGGQDPNPVNVAELGPMPQSPCDKKLASIFGGTGAVVGSTLDPSTLDREGGADIRFIQQLLGHVSLETTQIYTQVSIRQLKATHTATHPARLHRSAGADQAASADAPTEDAREDLLSMLAAEAPEEDEADDSPP